MADLRVFLAGRMTFDATLDIDHLIADFLDNYYGGGEAAAKIDAYIKLIDTAFLTANASVDFTGRALNPKYVHKFLSPNSSIFSNETLLTGATLLTDALKAATEPHHKARVANDLMHLQYVLLVRWDSLRLNATAMGKPWPCHNTKAEEFAAFAAAYNASGIQSFTETRIQADGHGHSISRVEMTLASFYAELFGGSMSPVTPKGVCVAGLTKKCGAKRKGSACKICAKALEKSQPTICPTPEVVRAWERAHC